MNGTTGDSSPATRAPHLLLVDDEPAIRLALQRFMMRRGWTVEACASGVDAYARLVCTGAEHEIDAILCDVKMPGMSGIEFYRALEQARPMFLTRLVLATGDVASADVAEFLAAVRCPILEKPFALSALAEALASVSSRATPAATPRA
jgi:CheY-like chemotaxis protein